MLGRSRFMKIRESRRSEIMSETPLFPPPRILVAKAGLDGHDRGALLVCLALRDAGCEVLYTGIRNTPAQIVAAAIQEDVDGVGLSSLSGAHKALFPRVVTGLREAGAGRIALFAGGIFPKPDRDFLMQAGVERLFHPGTAMKEICDFCTEAARMRRAQSPDGTASEKYQLAAKLTLIEQENGTNANGAHDSHIVGITGPGGTGKSTMIDALINEGLRRNEKVAVLCVDPSSIRSGGAFLGDRIRMQRRAASPGVFIRSVATRGSAGGVPGCIGAMATALRQAGYDWVFIETVGTGQDQVEIRKHVGRMILAAAPGQGDTIQIFKSNALEVADLVAVTRADQGKSEEYAKEVAATLRATRRDETVPVLVVSGERGTGVDKLMDTLAS